jgi:hypothetical protein
MADSESTLLPQPFLCWPLVSRLCCCSWQLSRWLATCCAAAINTLLSLSPACAGRPSQEDLDAIGSPFASTMMESCSVTQAKHIADMFPHASEDALDLLVKLLQVSSAVCGSICLHAWLRVHGL